LAASIQSRALDFPQVDYNRIFDQIMSMNKLNVPGQDLANGILHLIYTLEFDQLVEE
jgi:hypothetical protein